MKGEVMEEKKLLFERTAEQTKKWKKLLDELQQENILQKNKLAEFLKGNNNEKGYLVAVAEEYQNQFLQQDDAFRFIKNDISELEKLFLKKEKVKEADQYSSVRQQKIKLRKEITTFHANFNELSAKFTMFLLSSGSLCL
jgi:hypothetical protein